MFLLAVGLGFAGVPEDLHLAADRDQPLALRQEAYGRLATVDVTAEVLRMARSKDTPAVERWVAVRALGTNPSPEARAALIEFLDSPNAPTRMAALGGIGERVDRTLSGRVASKLADPAILVRAAAADALALLKDASTVPDLARALKDPTNTYRGQSLWVRRHFVDALSAIGSHDAAPALAAALEDRDPAVATSAMHALERMAGFSYREGRTPAEEREAWKRWAGKK